MRLTSTFISYLCHPLWMPTIGLSLLLNVVFYPVSIDAKYLLWIYLFNIFFTVVFPLLLLLFFRWSNIVSSIYLEERTERLLPLFSAVVFYAMNAYFQTVYLKLPFALTSYTFGLTTTLFLALLINLKYKISLHLIGVGGLFGLLLAAGVLFRVDLRFYMIFTLLLSGGVGLARLVLKAHHPLEIYLGFALGCLGVFCTIYFLNHGFKSFSV